MLIANFVGVFYRLGPSIGASLHLSRAWQKSTSHTSRSTFVFFVGSCRSPRQSAARKGKNQSHEAWCVVVGAWGWSREDGAREENYYHGRQRREDQSADTDMSTGDRDHMLLTVVASHCPNKVRQDQIRGGRHRPSCKIW